MSGPYFVADQERLFLDGSPIEDRISRSQACNDALRQFARFMVNGPEERGSIHQFASGSPLMQLNNGDLQTLDHEGVTYRLPDINLLKREACAIYDDALVDHSQAREILRVKAGLQHRPPDKPLAGNLVTLMLPSRLCLLPADHGVKPAGMMEIRIVNFTYPHFAHFSHTLKSSLQANVRSMIRLNVLATCREAHRQGKPLPFIVNPPGAFVRSLTPAQVRSVAEMISESLADIWSETGLRPVLDALISEWILLKPDFWPPLSGRLPPLHRVNADILHIAESLWLRHGAACPVPMMGEPLGAVGNGALGEHANHAVDEFLFRACGGIHGLTGSLRYNPDMTILPLSRVIAELKSCIAQPSGLFPPRS